MIDQSTLTSSHPLMSNIGYTSSLFGLLIALMSSLTVNPQRVAARPMSAADDLLMIRYHSVRAHNAQGKDWDIQPSSGPDLYIKLYVGPTKLWASPVMRDVTLRKGERERLASLTPISRYTLRERAVHSEPMRLEVWDQDLLQDDLVASFELSSGEVLGLKSKSRLLSSASIQLSLAWRAQPSPDHQIRGRGELRVVPAKPPSVKSLPVKSPSVKSPSVKSPSVKIKGAELRESSARHRPTDQTQVSGSTCVQVHQSPELTLSFTLDEIPGGGRAVLSSLRALARVYQERLKSSQIQVEHCLSGADLSSKMGLGSGWIRVHDQTLKVYVHRSYLGRSLMRSSDLRALLVNKLCRRVLELRSPLCRREVEGDLR